MSIKENRRRALFASLEAADIPVEGTDLDNPVIPSVNPELPEATSPAQDPVVINTDIEPVQGEGPVLSEQEAALVNPNEGQPVDASQIGQEGTVMEDLPVVEINAEPDQGGSEEPVVVQADDTGVDAEHNAGEEGSEFDDEGDEDEDDGDDEISLESGQVKPKTIDKKISKAIEVSKNISNVRASGAIVDLFDIAGKSFRTYMYRDGKIAGQVDTELKTETANLNKATAILKQLTSSVATISSLEGEDLVAEAIKQKNAIETIYSLSFLAGFRLLPKDDTRLKQAKQATRDADGKRVSSQTTNPHESKVAAALSTFIGATAALVLPGGAVALAAMAAGNLFGMAHYMLRQRTTPNEQTALTKAGTVKLSSFTEAAKLSVKASIELMEASAELTRAVIAAKKDSNKESWAVLSFFAQVAGALTAPAVTNVSFVGRMLKPVNKAARAENKIDKEQGRSVESGDPVSLVEGDRDQPEKASIPEQAKVIETDGAEEVEGKAAPVMPADAPVENAEVTESVPAATQTAEKDAGDLSDSIAGESVSEAEEVELTDEEVEKTLQDEQAALESANREMYLLTCDLNLLRDVEASLESAIGNGGMRRESAEIMHMTIEGIADRTGINFSNPVSLESFDGFSQRMVSTEVSLESVREFLGEVASKVTTGLRNHITKSRNDRQVLRTLSGNVAKDIAKQRNRINELTDSKVRSIKSNEIARILAPSGGEVTLEGIKKLFTTAKATAEAMAKKNQENVNTNFKEAVFTEDHAQRLKVFNRIMTPPASVTRRLGAGDGFELRDVLPNGYMVTIVYDDAQAADIRELDKIVSGYRENVSFKYSELNPFVNTLTKEQGIELANLATDIDKLISDIYGIENATDDKFYDMDEDVARELKSKFGDSPEKLKEHRRLVAMVWTLSIRQGHHTALQALVALNRGILMLLKKVK